MNRRRKSLRSSALSVITSVLTSSTGVALLSCDEAVMPGAEPGQPLPELEAQLLERFALGQQLFNRPFTAEQGLGPLFNQDRCSSCHDLPTLGGSGAEFVRKATRWEPPATCDLLDAEGGDNIQMRATPLLTAQGVERESTPPSATHVAQLTPPALYGLGLVEAVDDATIRALEDPDDRDGDGISGRAVAIDGGVGRFGRKASHTTLASFISEALSTEMGLTSATHPHEQTIGGSPIPAGVDPALDPEMNAHDFALLVDYVRFLAPTLASPPPATAAARDSIAQGARIFEAIGCAKCHVPELRTGPSQVRPLDRRRFRIYSDFLLHDMGPRLATICGSEASPSEFRTAPLAGLRHRILLLHDGRAESFEAAVRFHGGEAENARQAFESLSSAHRTLILRFLETL